eukprot:CAMPEP_0194506418 /NCGR_PEP_ID=MMETSP0253-20130528/34918_1 /TAXON_ID=2966 /ORGANISM="Noctiluca scintillans" /LENGTH=314 /DNA_ID=CAMNT_0039349161 /DNA_START=1 /DNA_END=945 /DNA_ORIENTATION=+
MFAQLRVSVGAANLLGGIPNIIWVTGPWDDHSREAAQMRGNLRLSTFLRTKLETKLTAQSFAVRRFASVAPPDASFRYLDNEDMDRSAQEISHRLAQAGVVPDAYAAFSLLRPAAFRADLWRYMVLWDSGGVYLDMNLELSTPLSAWIDFEKDDLVLVKDHCGSAYWNAMMASAPRRRPLELVIQEVVRRIEKRSYGRNPLDVTGPVVLYSATHAEHPKVEYEWDGERVLDLATHLTQIASKDSELHHRDSQLTHYDSLWRGSAAFCDEAGPPGMCRQSYPVHLWHPNLQIAASELQQKPRRFFVRAATDVGLC